MPALDIDPFDVPAPSAPAVSREQRSRDTSEGGAPGTSGQRLGLSAPAAKRLAIIDRLEKHDYGGAGRVAFEPEEVNVDLAAADNAQYALIFGAAYECGMHCAHQGDCSDNSQATGDRWQSPQVQPKAYLSIGPGGPLVFDYPGQGNCERKLLQQEMLVCMAEKLVELSEAVGPVIWDSINTGTDKVGVTLPDGIPGGPWVIAPLQDQERFIAREQAIRLLMRVADLDTDQSGPNWVGWVPAAFSGIIAVDTCDEAYYKSLTEVDEATWPSVSVPLFGYEATQDPPFDAQGLVASYLNREELIEARLERRVKTLTLAGELLRGHLIEKSVYADLAGAYQRRAAATDPVRGLQLMWGTADDALIDVQDQQYNNMHHAARMLFGDWESWTPDSKEDAIHAIDKAGPLFAGSRDRDLPASTPDEEAAASLFMAAGIVVPEDLTYPGGSLTRADLRNQLVEKSLMDRGYVPGSSDYIEASKMAPAGLAFDELSEHAIAFGLKKTEIIFSQLTGIKLTVNPLTADDPPWKKSPAWVDGHAETYGFTAGWRSAGFADGVVWKGGLPMSLLTGDVTARVASMANFGAHTTLCENAVPGCAEEVTRSVFHLGSVLQANLGAIKVPEELSELAEERARALAQFNSWVGPGQLRVTWHVDSGNVVMRAVGIFAEEMGWPPLALGNVRIVAVVGEYWAADCVAGNRPESQCPGDPWNNNVVLPWYWVPESNFNSPEDLLRSDGTTRVDRIMFHADDPLIASALDYANADRPKLYLVSMTSPQSTGKGQVLAEIKPFPSYASSPLVWTTYVLSSHQRELANAAFGVSSEASTQGIYVGAATTGDPNNYCIPGVRKDEFVPLENELTENSDAYENSWRYYLNLAQDAADRAQTIADQMFDLDLQQKLRFEGAQEEYAALCGDFTDLDDIEWNDGTPNLEHGSDSGSQCLNPDTWDVVFLANMNAVTLNDMAKTAGLSTVNYLKQRVLQCATNDPRDACSAAEVTWAAVPSGIPPVPDVEEGEVPAGCWAVANAHSTLASEFDPSTVENEGCGTWRDEQALLEVIEGMKLHVGLDGEWSLSYWDQGIMDSHSDQPLWPGCLWATDPEVHCEISGDAPETAALSRSLFPRFCE